MPSLNLDFELMAKEKDAKQFDVFFNFLLSIWKMTGKNEVEVLDYNSEFKKEVIE